LPGQWKSFFLTAPFIEHSRAAKRQKNFSLARKRQVNCHRVFKPGTGGRYTSLSVALSGLAVLGPCIPRAYEAVSETIGQKSREVPRPEQVSKILLAARA
jgi:hypothetical protein